jgi:hypothetical protein
MILVVRISDLQEIIALNDAKTFDIFSMYDSTYKILFLSQRTMDRELQVWGYDLSTTKTKFKNSYRNRAEYMMDFYIDGSEFVRFHRYCDLYDKRTTLNTREQSEYDTFRAGRSALNTYNSTLAIIQWKEATYAESTRLIGLVNAATDIQSIFNITENYTTYPG